MDEIENNARYPPNPYRLSGHQASGSVEHTKVLGRSAPHPQGVGGVNRYPDDDDDDDNDEEEEEEEEEVEEEVNGNVENDADHGLGKDYEDGSGGDDDDDDDRSEEATDDDFERKEIHIGRTDGGGLERHPKKRKLKNVISTYEFAPRAPAPLTATVSAPKVGGRNTLTDWSEHETFALLDAWGDKFLQLGRKSLRAEEWHEVSEKVSRVSKMDRTDTQCRNRLDTLKKKYKKEKMKLAESTDGSSKWVYFKKMDVLMSTSPKQGALSCGMDSGEYVFTNPKAYLNRANGFDEMRDSPGNSESSAGKEDDSDGLPPRRPNSRREVDDRSSFRLLANSIQKFSEIYEKIENSKRQQMMELEKMRMDFHRELEQQKRQILEKAQAEIAKMRRGDDEDNGLSAENISG